jgi:hypothetical protein
MRVLAGSKGLGMAQASCDLRQMDALRARWMGATLEAAEQGLVDLAASSGSEVSFVRYEDPAILETYVDELLQRAQLRGFVTARLSVAESGTFDSFDVLVRNLLGAVRGPTAPRAKRSKEKGLVTLLDAFLHKEGRAAVSTFDANLGRLGASGDLIALARAYLDSAKKPRREAARIEAWMSGVELVRFEVDSVAVSALAARTAKRALAELTRLVRALGHAGALFCFTEADSLLRLPPARREDAYTILRELVDNTDSGRGLVATRLVVAGQTPLFVGPRSLASLVPLQSRVASNDDGPPTPHRPMVDLVLSLFASTDTGPEKPVMPPGNRAAEMRAIIRGAQGLPPTEAILSLSVGHEAIDAAIDDLFEHSAMEGSVFTLLAGAYGTGKTHLLLHLAARARADKRPVLRLSLERLDADLGNPQRHLRRMLDQAELPLPGNPSLLDLLSVWTHTERRLGALLRELEKVAEEGTEASQAAAKVLRAAHGGRSKGSAIESVLGGLDLESKPNGPGYRQDAYGRLLLWLALLERLEGCAGPVLLIDEAENLYKGGSSRPERRTALRSLAFYCGGALPRACVVLAITPEVLPELRAEAKDLLEEVEEQRTLLTWEDASMFRRRLARAKAITVPGLLDEHREILALRVRKTHAAVRGAVRDAGWSEHLQNLAGKHVTPRDIVRRTFDRLERIWWQNG